MTAYHFISQKIIGQTSNVALPCSPTMQADGMFLTFWNFLRTKRIQYSIWGLTLDQALCEAPGPAMVLNLKRLPGLWGDRCTSTSSESCVAGAGMEILRGPFRSTQLGLLCCIHGRSCLSQAWTQGIGQDKGMRRLQEKGTGDANIQGRESAVL